MRWQNVGEGWASSAGTDLAFKTYVGSSCPTPVRGFMQPANKAGVFAPYLTLLGLVGAVAIVVAKPWKKREN